MGKLKLYFSKIIHYMEAQEIKGKISLVKIFIDIAFCMIAYGATISDYFMYRFYQKSAHERKKFITARDKNRFYKIVCDPSYRKEIQNKDLFNEHFAEHLKRNSINVPECGKEAFCEFVAANKIVFLKPVATGGGEGILKISAEDELDFGELYDMVGSRGQYVAEAGIVQHSAMAQLHEQSVNSLRIATVYDGQDVQILFAGMRCGTGDSFVDNHMTGGILMLLDPETGRVSSLASSKGKLNILKHPDTGIFLPGFQIPHWDKCLELIDRVARQVKGVYYIGWDVAILENDICLIEANPGGDFVTWQEPTQTGHRAELYACMEHMKKRLAKWQIQGKICNLEDGPA